MDKPQDSKSEAHTFWPFRTSMLGWEILQTSPNTIQGSGSWPTLKGPFLGWPLTIQRRLIRCASHQAAFCKFQRSGSWSTPKGPFLGRAPNSFEKHTRWDCQGNRGGGLRGGLVKRSGNLVRCTSGRILTQWHILARTFWPL